MTPTPSQHSRGTRYNPGSQEPHTQTRFVAAPRIWLAEIVSLKVLDDRARELLQRLVGRRRANLEVVPDRPRGCSLDQLHQCSAHLLVRGAALEPGSIGSGFNKVSLFYQFFTQALVNDSWHPPLQLKPLRCRVNRPSSASEVVPVKRRGGLNPQQRPVGRPSMHRADVPASGSPTTHAPG